MATTKATTKNLSFTFERETKNTIRFAEQLADSLDTPVLGTIYVSKHALKEMGYATGNTITMTLAVAK